MYALLMTKSRLDLCRSFGAFEVHQTAPSKTIYFNGLNECKKRSLETASQQARAWRSVFFFYGDIPICHVASPSRHPHLINRFSWRGLIYRLARMVTAYMFCKLLGQPPHHVVRITNLGFSTKKCGAFRASCCHSRAANMFGNNQS